MLEGLHQFVDTLGFFGFACSDPLVINVHWGLDLITVGFEEGKVLTFLEVWYQPGLVGPFLEPSLNQDIKLI